MLKTTSPTWVPVAPKDFPRHMDPSSSTSRQSDVFQGRAPANSKNKHISSRYPCHNHLNPPSKIRHLQPLQENGHSQHQISTEKKIHDQELQFTQNPSSNTHNSSRHPTILPSFVTHFRNIFKVLPLILRKREHRHL